ncbi:metallophosphoesterase [Candidatus Roizmanbacteria bacterium]|nr:MAG: metallophosphoesterase [Candidatus Roizmanbacteria bacterium]
MKIAATADLHVREIRGEYRPLFQEISSKADVLLLCGDLTDRGLESELSILIEDLEACTIPTVAVFGNHDVESGQGNKLKEALQQTHVTVLDGDSTIIQDVGFAGIKGFCGGFDNYMLTPWGEKIIKDFVQESLDESILLEKALSRLSTEKKVVLMHYAPISATVKGEPPEIFPYLGCSRLASPINRYGAAVVFHGHAHHGSPKGMLNEKVPVFNVSQQVLLQKKNAMPYFLYTI